MNQELPTNINQTKNKNEKKRIFLNPNIQKDFFVYDLIPMKEF